MTKNLTLRVSLTFLALDLLFAPFVILAFTQLLGAGTASEPASGYANASAPRKMARQSSAMALSACGASGKRSAP